MIKGKHDNNSLTIDEPISKDALIDQYLLSELGKNNSVSIKEDTHELSDLYHKARYYLRKYWLLIIVLMLFFSSIGWFLNIQKPLLFRATTSMIQDSSTHIGQTRSSFSQYYFQLQHYFETQSKIINSDQLAERVANSLLSSDRSYTYSNQNYIDYLVEKSAGRFYYSALKWVDSFVNNNKHAQEIDISPSLMKSGVRINIDEKVKSMELSFISSSPYLARDAANQFANDFIDYKYEKSAQEIDNSLIWLSNKLDASRAALNESQKKLLDFQKNNQLLDSDEIKNITNNSLQASYGDLLRLRGEYQETLSKYGDKHPSVREARLQLDKAKRAYDNLALSGFSNKTKEVELTNLENDLENNRKIYETYLTRFSEASFETKQSESITIVPDILDSAQLPSYPFSPNPARSTFEWMFFGLASAFLIIFFREVLNQTFRTEDDVRRFTDKPILGDMPFINGSALKKAIDNKSSFDKSSNGSTREFYALHHPLSIFSEKINHIRTSLLFNQKQRAQVIMISSASQGEGKTILSTNLSYSFSRLGKTILIDCDLRRPRIAKLVSLEKSSEPGLVEYMAGLNPLEECIKPLCGMQGFDSLASDITPPEPLEMLSTRRFEELIYQLREQYEYIIIDMPPILPVSDAVVVGKLVDSAILIVKSMKTQKKLLKSALERFDSAGVNLSGIVVGSLNKKHMTYYGSDYKYGGHKDNKKS